MYRLRGCPETFRGTNVRGKRGHDECFSVPGLKSAFLRQRLLNCPFLFDLSQPFPPLTLTKQPPKYLWKCKAGTSAL